MSPQELARPRILFIVRRDEERVYHHLRQAFAGHGAVQVVLDRRAGDRRGTDRGMADNRRRGDRRWPTPSDSEQELWRLAGFRIVLRPDDIEVFDAGSDLEAPR